MSKKTSGASVEVAARLPGEYELVSAIVADLRDDTVKLAYADWLDERGDPRSVFVREFVAAAHALNGRFPDSSPYPRAWTNMLGVPLVQGLVEYDLAKVKDSVLKVARPMVTITTKRVEDKLIRIGDSKFGGLPDLPADVAWPVCEEGRLAFLGQMALADLASTQAGRHVPRNGVLSFFAYDHDGYQPGNFHPETGVTQVIYTAATAKLVRRQPPEGDEAKDCEVLPACRLTMCEALDLPSHGDRLPKAYAKDMKKLQTSDTKDGLWRIRSRFRPDGHFGHHLLGYSCHFRTDDPSPGPDWPHLLCLDSDDNMHWNWCDGEHLAVFVQEGDLRNCTFARVYGYAS
jgi:uncharacterized protein (TIGR02996 family)